MRYREKKDTQQDINISPLIDMVFILLIFFMVTTTFVKDMDLDIDRPTASSSSASSSKAIRIYIDESGSVYLDEQPVRVWAIQSRLRDLLSVSSDKSVLVVADTAVQTGRLVEVVDQARMSGADDVGVATHLEVGRGS